MNSTLRTRLPALLLTASVSCLIALAPALAANPQPHQTAPTSEAPSDAEDLKTVIAEIAPKPSGYDFVVRTASQILGAPVIRDGEQVGTITDLAFAPDGKLQDVVVESWRESGDSTIDSLPFDSLAFREVVNWTDGTDPPPLETGK